MAIQQVATDAFGNALGESIKDQMVSAGSLSTADNRSALNAAERAADPDRYSTPIAGSGLMPGRGSAGFQLSSDAVDRWSSTIDTGIASDAENLARTDRFLDMLPTADASGNFFGIPPSDDRGFFPEGDSSAKRTRDELDRAMVDGMSAANDRNRQHVLSNFTADALREQQLRDSPGAGETPWLLQRNPVLGAVNDWLTDSLVDFGRTSPTLAGAGQVVRYGLLGDGSNLDAGLAAVPLLGRFAHGAVAFESAVFGERSAVQLGESTAVRGLGLAEGGELGSVLFGQKRVGPTFGFEGRPSYLAGREISAVADDLRAGALHSDQLPIDAFYYNGKLVSANTRSLSALSEAGLEPTKINLIEPSRSLLRRLGEDPLISNAPLPGPRVPVTPTQNDLTILRVIEIPRRGQ